MTSRERVRAVIDHRIPDRIPNGLGGCETAGLHVLAYRNLLEAIGMPESPPRIDTFMTNAVFEKDVIDAIEGDIILLASPRMCKASLRGSGFQSQWKEQILWDKTFRVPIKDKFISNSDGSVVWETCGNVVCPKGAYFFDNPGGTNLMEDFEYPSPDGYNPPHELSEELLRDLETTAKEIYESTELSICLGETITDLQVQPGGMIGSMILMKQEPGIMKEFLQKSMDSALAQLKQLNQAVGKYVDILSIAHDFGDNRGVTIGDELWREIYKPFYMDLFQGWQKITDMKINLHSCGSISSILEDLIECGVQILNPVQTSANNMSAQLLKDKYGDRLVFWGGGYDAQLFSREDSYEEVFQKVHSAIETLKQGGRYIFAGVHNLPADTSTLHLSAMLDAYRSTREYHR